MRGEIDENNQSKNNNKKIRTKLKTKNKLNIPLYFSKGKIEKREMRRKQFTSAQPPCHHAHTRYQWKEDGEAFPTLPSKVVFRGGVMLYNLLICWGVPHTHKILFFNNIYINQKIKSLLSTCLL